MTQEETKQLPNGIYRLWWSCWNGTGFSLAAVGRNESGECWFAPVNWVEGIPCFDWEMVQSVDKVTCVIVPPDAQVDTFYDPPTNPRLSPSWIGVEQAWNRGICPCDIYDADGSLIQRKIKGFDPKTGKVEVYLLNRDGSFCEDWHGGSIMVIEQYTPPLVWCVQVLTS